MSTSYGYCDDSDEDEVEEIFNEVFQHGLGFLTEDNIDEIFNEFDDVTFEEPSNYSVQDDFPVYVHDVDDNDVETFLNDAGNIEVIGRVLKGIVDEIEKDEKVPFVDDASIDKLNELGLLKKEAESIDLSTLPRYPSDINICFIEKAYNLFMAKFFPERSSVKGNLNSISPLSVLEWLSGSVKFGVNLTVILPNPLF